MIVFVHGVPETGAIWRRTVAALDPGLASVVLELPGFGNPRPEGFGATKDDYVDWLLGALDAIGEPVDLVGHDWGAGFTYRVATAHGDRLRSWVADVGGIAHPDYVWHDFAKIWQTPGDGEAFFEAQEAAGVEGRAATLELLGIHADDAADIATAGDLVMGSCILDLYRSALPNPHADWGPWSPTSAPGLILHPTDDPFSDGALGAEVAAALGAGYEVLDGAGHFWPSQAPEAGAAALTKFWSTLG